MLQIYRTGIIFFYTYRHLGDDWEEGEVERS